MGCLSMKAGRDHYTDTDFTEDGEFRQFEVAIGGHKLTFNSVLQKICMENDKIPISTVENFILKDFDEKFKKAIAIDYFYKEQDGKKFYDAKKLKLLLFLTTQESLIVTKKKYYDKVKIYNVGKFYIQLYQFRRIR